MRAVFFGTSAFAVPSLERLAASRHTVLACVTQPDRPQGRGLAREPSPVKQAALRLGLRLEQPERLDAAQLAPLAPDVGVVAAYGNMIRPALLALPARGMLGVHPSLLPKYRGAAPVTWAILNGETQIGVTIFRLNERLDAGAILRRQAVAIGPAEHAGLLLERLAELGADELLSALDAIEEGRETAVPQEEAQATFAPKLTKAHGRIDWRAPADVIGRLVRATVPWPGATTEWQGKPLRVWAASAHAAGSRASAPAGTAVAVGDGIITVSAGQGTAVDLLEVQPSGRRRMSVREFLAGHPVRIGDRFGVRR